MQKRVWVAYGAKNLSSSDKTHDPGGGGVKISGYQILLSGPGKIHDREGGRGELD